MEVSWEGVLPGPEVGATPAFSALPAYEMLDTHVHRGYNDHVNPPRHKELLKGDEHLRVKLRGLDLPCRDGGSMEGHEQVDLKADTINSELCRVSLRVGRFISWPWVPERAWSLQGQRDLI